MARIAAACPFVAGSGVKRENGLGVGACDGLGGGASLEVEALDGSTSSTSKKEPAHKIGQKRKL